MIKYKNMELDINSISEDFTNMFLGASKMLKSNHPNLDVMPVSKSKSVLTGVVLAIVDSITIDATDIVDMEVSTARRLTNMLSNSITLAILERNVIDTKFVNTLTKDTLMLKLDMLLGNTRTVDITMGYKTKPQDEDIVRNIVLKEYNEFSD